MSLDTRGVQIANGSKNPDDEQFNVDTEIPEAHDEALFEHILQLAKGILSTRKYQVFKKVWADLDLSTQQQLVVHALRHSANTSE